MNVDFNHLDLASVSQQLPSNPLLKQALLFHHKRLRNIIAPGF